MTNNELFLEKFGNADQWESRLRKMENKHRQVRSLYADLKLHANDCSAKYLLRSNLLMDIDRLEHDHRWLHDLVSAGIKDILNSKQGSKNEL